MRYDKYEQRLMKIAKFFKAVFRNMTKIIITASILLVITISLLATRGIIVSAESCPKEITYGEELKLEARAFMSGAYYEYRPVGGKWQTDVPTAPGDYEIRAVAKATFGYRYGDTEKFTIKPKEVTISVVEGDYVFGDDPKLVADLEFKDEIKAVDFIYSDDMDHAEIDLASLKIKNKNGKDVTSSYVIKTIGADIVTLERSITVKTPSAEKVYDGEALMQNEYEITSGSVAKTNELHISYDNSITDVGSIKNSFGIAITDKSGKDVTKYYSITKDIGTLKVTKRPLNFSTPSDSLVYDGVGHKKDSYDFTEGTSLASGQSLVIDGFKSIINVGSIKNDFDYYIADKDGNDVTRNYSITESFGTLKITSRPITVYSDSYEGVYDAMFHSSTKHTSEGLANGHTVFVNEDAPVEIFDVGERINELDYSILDKDGNDVTKNYTVTEKWGTLKITPKKITVETPSDSKVYDLSELYNYEDITHTALAGTDKIEINDYSIITDVSSVKNEISFRIINEELEKDVTDNYEIELIEGTLTVTKRPIHILTPSASWEYDGTKKSFADPYELSILSGELCGSHSLYVDAITEIIDVTDGVKNELKIKIYDDDVDLSGNYEITVDYGTLVITARDLTINTSDDKREYNGTPLINQGFTTENLASLHSVTVLSSSEITNVGSVTNEFSDFDILDENGRSVKHNYTVTFNNGTLTVTKLPITVTTMSGSKVYDGAPLTGPDWLLSLSSPNALVSGHVIEAPAPGVSITNFGSVTNAGVGAKDIRIKLGETDMTENYEISVEYGILEITRRPLTVYTDTYNEYYDGKLHAFNTVYESLDNGSLGLANGQSFVVSNVNEYKNVTDNEINELLFYISDGISPSPYDDVTDNYEITYEYGTVTIRQRPVTVITNSYRDYYDGKEHFDDSVIALVDDGSLGLCIDEEAGVIHKIIIDTSSVPVFKNVVTDAENYIEFYISDQSGEYPDDDVTANYSITCNYGSFTIDKRPVTITTDSYMDYYDGLGHSSSNVSAVIGENSLGLCLDTEAGVEHKIVIDEDTVKVFKNVYDSGVNDISFYISDGTDAPTDDVTDNYEITYEYGSFIIEPRPIKIYTVSYNGVYDGYDHSDYNIYYDVDTPYELCEGHTFVTSNTTVIKNHILDSKNSLDFYIADESAFDVTENYDVDMTYGDVNVYKRSIKIYTVGYDAVYDGKDHSDSNIYFAEDSEYELCEGHTFVTSNTTVIKNHILDSKNLLDFYITDESAFDVTENYDVDMTYGDVNVYKRSIKVYTESYNEVYDGKDHSDANIYFAEDSEYELCEGHTFVTSNTTVIKNHILDSKNSLDFYISDGTEAPTDDVTENYDVDITYGDVNVYKRYIKLYTESYEDVYDGKDHSDYNIYYDYDTPYELCEGHNFVISNTTVIKNAVSGAKNSLDFYISDGTEAPTDDVTENYDFDMTYGDVNVYKRSIKIYTVGYEGVYDGKDHSDPTLYFADDSLYGLCEDHEFYTWNHTKIKDAISGIKNSLEFYISDTNETMYPLDNVTANYEIECSFGDVNVYKRSIKIYTTGYEGVYDGYDHSDPELYFAEDSEYPLCEDHNFVISNTTVIKNAVSGAKNSLDYYISDGKENVTKNYEIECSFGDVNIAKRSIKIYTEGYEGVYDGKDHSDPNLHFADDSKSRLCDGHNFVISNTTVIKNAVSGAKNSLDYYISDGTEAPTDDVTANYEIKCSFGDVNIAKRSIKIYTKGYEGVYDGKDHSDPNLHFAEDSEYELCDGHNFVISNTTVIKNAVTGAKNSLDYYISDGTEAPTDDVTANYEIECSFGDVNIAKREITITTEGCDSMVYDGIEHTFVNSLVENLSDNHTLKIKTPVVFRNVVTDAENNIEYLVLDENSKDATENYVINYVYGKVTITQRRVYIKTGSDSWHYDGKVHSCTDYELLEDTSFAPADRVLVESTEIKDIGTLENIFTIKVNDKMFNDLSFNYIIEYAEWGILEILPVSIEDIKISIKSQSAEKFYDGSPLECHEFVITSHNEYAPFPEEYRIVASGWASITEIGLISNSYDKSSLRILDADGNDITDSIEIVEMTFGTLEVRETTVMFIVNSSNGGLVYLKQSSYGDYGGRMSWQAAASYGKLYNGASASYIPSLVFESTTMRKHSIRIESLFGLYVLPYYATGDMGDIQTSDTTVSGNAWEPYELYYYAPLSTPSVQLSGELGEYEADYRKFVYENYLTIDTETLTFMYEIIEEEGFTLDDPHVIDKVAEYIQNAADYDFEFGNLESEKNVAIAFLRDYKRGVCRHYATAATLLYRALGIPARYTTGFVANTVAGEDCEVTIDKAHAWVEVYISGLGWVNVEVTGSASGNVPEQQKPTIEITPIYTEKKYDGTPLTAPNELMKEGTFGELLSLGYTYTVEVSGSLTEVGYGESYIVDGSFRLFDPDGNDVTANFDVIANPGTLYVSSPNALLIYLEAKKYVYTGKDIGFTNDEIIPLNLDTLPEGMKVSVEIIDISRRDVGKITSLDVNRNISKYIKYTVTNADGEDVTQFFELRVVDLSQYLDQEGVEDKVFKDYDLLTITTRSITITTASATKAADGTPLIADSYTISYGKLCDGHIAEIIVTGNIAEKGSVDNFVSISDCYITDEYGNIVFDGGVEDKVQNYEVTFILGKLTIT